MDCWILSQTQQKNPIQLSNSIEFLVKWELCSFAIFGNFEVKNCHYFLATFGSKMLPKMAKMWLKFLYGDRVTILLPILAIICNQLLPFLATLRSIKIAIFGNFWKQNVAKNDKNVTQVPIWGKSNHSIAILESMSKNVEWMSKYSKNGNNWQ